LDQNNVSSDITLVHDASANLLPYELQNQANALALNSQLGTNDFGKTPIATTEQQYRLEAPTPGVQLASVAVANKSLSFTIPQVQIKPSITAYIQQVRIGVGSDLQFRLDSGFLWGGDMITRMPTITYQSVNRICYYYVQNYVTKMILYFPFTLDSLAQVTGTTTVAQALKDPYLKQGDVNVYLGLGGVTGFVLDITHQTNVFDWIDTILRFLGKYWWIIAIIIAIVVLLIVYKVWPKGGGSGGKEKTEVNVYTSEKKERRQK